MGQREGGAGVPGVVGKNSPQQGNTAAGDPGEREGTPDPGVYLQQMGTALAVLLEFEHGKAGVARFLHQPLGIIPLLRPVYTPAAGGGPAGDGIFPDALVADGGGNAAPVCHHITAKARTGQVGLHYWRFPAERGKAAVMGLRLLRGADNGVAGGGG